MKDDALFINIGRGESVVTADAHGGAASGVASAAPGLDVTDPEPLPPGHPLWSMRNVIITPHIATSSDFRSDRTVTLVAENVRRYSRGDALLSVVDLAARATERRDTPAGHRRRARARRLRRSRPVACRVG